SLRLHPYPLPIRQTPRPYQSRSRADQLLPRPIRRVPRRVQSAPRPRQSAPWRPPSGRGSGLQGLRDVLFTPPAPRLALRADQSRLRRQVRLSVRKAPLRVPRSRRLVWKPSFRVRPAWQPARSRRPPAWSRLALIRSRLLAVQYTRVQVRRWRVRG